MPLTRSAIVEITAVIVTGIGKFLFVDFLHLKFWYIISASLFWTAYLIYKISTDNTALTRWGLRRKGFRQTLIIVLPIAVAVILGFILYGWTKNTLILNWHIIPIMILYPLWGTLQQFLIIGIIAGTLHDSKISLPKSMIILAASLLFSIVHFPAIPLAIATFVLAVFYTFLYLQYRNLWVLGLFHGWLGGLFYFFVLHRDPWMEFLEAVR